MKLERIQHELQWEWAKLSQLHQEAESKGNLAMAMALDSIADGVNKACLRLFAKVEKKKKKQKKGAE